MLGMKAHWSMGHPHAVRVVRGRRRQVLVRLHARTVLRALQTQTATHPQHVSAAPVVSMLHRRLHHAQTVPLGLLTWTPVHPLHVVLVPLASTQLQARRPVQIVLQVRLILTRILHLHVTAAAVDTTLQLA